MPDMGDYGLPSDSGWGLFNKHYAKDISNEHYAEDIKYYEEKVRTHHNKKDIQILELLKESQKIYNEQRNK